MESTYVNAFGVGISALQFCGLVLGLLIFTATIIYLTDKVKEYRKAKREKKSEVKPTETKSEKYTDQLRLVAFQVMEGQEETEKSDLRAVIETTRKNKHQCYDQLVRYNGKWYFAENFTRVLHSRAAEDNWGGTNRTTNMMDNVDRHILWEQKYGPSKDLEFGSNVPKED